MSATIQQSSLKEQLLANLGSSLPNDSLFSFRISALEQFEKNDFPNQRNEEWKYVNLKPIVTGNFERVNSKITKEEFDKLSFSNLDGIHLVMVDGRYAGNFSNESTGLTILPIKEGANQFPDLFEKHFDQSRLQEDNAFRQMNTAFSTEGVFIYLVQNKTINQPVFVHHIYKNPCLALVRNFVWLGENAELNLIEIVGGDLANTCFTNSTSEIFLGKSSRFSHYNLQMGNRNGLFVGMNYYHQQDSSLLNALTVTTQGSLVRNNIQAILDGRHIVSNLSGLYIINGKDFVDNHTLVDHRKPLSNSNELYKGLMDGNSTGVFNGKIFVRQDAQKTNAFQSNKNILLSPDASVNTKPQLEIFADDVKCSHGCTTGQLDEESMFYLRSRGIGEKEAKALLVKAYAFDVLGAVKNASLKSILEQLIDEKLKE